MIFLLTGIQAAGKSTVAQLLAERFPRSVHVRGDGFRRMIVNGSVDMTPEPDPEALTQLQLRYQLTASTVDTYAKAGFTVVTQDIILGGDLPAMVERIESRPLAVVVLAPTPEAVAQREAGRGKNAYDNWLISQLDDGLRKDTPRLGLWLDTSNQTPEQTVEEILARTQEALIAPEAPRSAGSRPTDPTATGTTE